MFTGLVRDVGQIVNWRKLQNSLQFSIETSLPINELSIGASVACNGACLTVVSVRASSSGKNIFDVEAGPQTLALTRFGDSNFPGLGAQVNLEPALKMGDAFGGHMVSGHVDALGTVLFNEMTGDGFWRLKIQYDEKFSHYVFKKGSVAIAGVSLTIAECNSVEHWLEIMLIPHTVAQTNLSQLQAHSLVEIEFDSQAKMVAELIAVMLPKLLKTTEIKN